jgi:hypothetical protein
VLRLCYVAVVLGCLLSFAAAASVVSARMGCLCGLLRAREVGASGSAVAPCRRGAERNAGGADHAPRIVLAGDPSPAGVYCSVGIVPAQYGHGLLACTGASLSRDARLSNQGQSLCTKRYGLQPRRQSLAFVRLKLAATAATNVTP